MTSPLRRRTAVIAAALLSATLTLTACGSDNDKSGDAGAGSTEGFPVTIDSPAGEITLTEKPEKIVVLGAGNYVDALAALNEAPAVLAGDDTEQVYLEAAPYLEGRYGEFVEGLFTGEGSPDAEAIGALNPDLIILADLGNLDEPVYKQLKQIAPVYTESSSEDWSVALSDMGKVTGKSERAEEIISEVSAEFAAARERIPGLQGKTFLAGWTSEAYPDITTVSEMNPLLTALGMVPADNMSRPPDRGEISAENLDQITADVLYADGDKSAWEDDPRFADLPAVKNGAVVFEDEILEGALATSIGPASVPWLLERILPVLEKSALNTGE